MITCCVYCKTPAESEAHHERLRTRYNSAPSAPEGWRTLKYGEHVPSEHRMYIPTMGWLVPRWRNHNTPATARPSGSAVAYCVKVE